MAAEENTLTPACSSLKCTLLIEVFLKMRMLKTSLSKDQTLILHEHKLSLPLFIFTTYSLQ